MLQGIVLPSWFEIEERLVREIRSTGLGEFRSYFNEHLPSISTVIRRVDHIRTAFYRAEIEAAHLLKQRFADIDIREVVQELLGVVGQMALIVAGSVLTGGVIGASAGALAGGVGIVPGAFTGMAAGLQASSWILTVLGLASIADYFVDGLPAILEHYFTGIQVVWNGTQGDDGLNPFGANELLVVESASHHFARGHVEVVVLLLSAIVDYLTRGRGSIGKLASEMRASSKGQRLAQWMIKHEDTLKRHPDLKRPTQPSGSHAPKDSPPAHPKSEQIAHKKPMGMPEHKVPCFSADNLHYSKIPEFDRQLGGQERGLNDLTVDEYLRGREAFKAGDVVRDPKVAKSARNLTLIKFKNDYFADFLAKNHPPNEAERMASDKAVRKMSTLAALHNPDLIAGGKDFIGDFGDKKINASIGPQWRSRIGGLDIAVKAIPESARKNTLLSVKLIRCGKI
ncbi:DUF6861 domain-containing protein [Pseudomonas sp. UBA1879]|uniref:DUF6861 domain-containing protein n=1 Tax=Pseudomonas sp. UBA1879 TaxID=1947305 RepID=UPI0025F843AC|nr:polymorphic toxin type 15 domain-containing protein [Pseudomonas sp. UBA1879]